MHLTQVRLQPRWIKIPCPDGTSDWINTTYIERFGAVGKKSSWIRMTGGAFDVPVAVPYSELAAAIVNMMED